MLTDSSSVELFPGIWVNAVHFKERILKCLLLNSLLVIIDEDTIVQHVIMRTLFFPEGSSAIFFSDFITVPKIKF